MWIKPDYKGTLEDLTQEVKNALVKFEEEKAAGTLKPVDENDPSFWL